MQRKILGLLFLTLLVFSARAQEKTRILFLLDGSGSMHAAMGKESRFTVAKKLLLKMVDSLQNIPNLEIALRVYGHQFQKQEQNCKDTKLEIPFGQGDLEHFQKTLSTIKARGTTLIAYSLQQASNDFPDKKARNVIILITDGIEECEGDPCQVSLALQERGVILRPFIIGIGLEKEFQEQFTCIGRYFEANTPETFEDVMNVVIAQAINNTTVLVKLLDDFGKATETNVPMTFHNPKDGLKTIHLVHTLDIYNNPDTLVLDPSNSWDLTVHTIPPIAKNNIELKAGQHNDIVLDAGQGTIELIIDGVSNYNNLKAIIYEAGTKNIINVQDFDKTEKYLTNTYDIEILSLPRIFENDIKVEQNKTTKLTIPQPGKLNLHSKLPFVGGIYRNHNNKTELVYNLENKRGQQIITLQPGKYFTITRKASEKIAQQSIINEFTIYSGKVISLNIY